VIKFYGYFRSSSAYRARIAFNLKGLPYEFIPIHLRKDGGQQKQPAYLSVNPQGLVPTVADGNFRVSQSMAIIEWLDETHPEPPLLPGSAEERAKIRAFAQIIGCDIHPLQNLRVLNYLQTNFDQDQKGLNQWCQHWIANGLHACEALLTERPETGFAFGTSPTLADICLVPQVFSAERFGVDLAGLPRVNAVVEHCNSLPAFAKAHPTIQPDAE
jgi:maleylacetoacetate isomerase